MSGTTQMSEIKSAVVVHGAVADGARCAEVIPLRRKSDLSVASL